MNAYERAELAHLLRQGASMVRKRLDALFAERLEQDYNEAQRMIRIASLILNAIAIVGGGWLLLAVFAACVNFY